jgi:hypothetical protein
VHKGATRSEVTQLVARAAASSRPAARMARRPQRSAEPIRTEKRHPNQLSRALRTILQEFTAELTSAVNAITAEEVRHLLAGRPGVRPRRSGRVR